MNGHLDECLCCGELTDSDRKPCGACRLAGCEPHHPSGCERDDKYTYDWESSDE